MPKQKRNHQYIPRVYEFTVSLTGTSPTVWRRFQAHEIIYLDELHILIQLIMGWEMRHLYEFRFGKTSYSSLEDLFKTNIENAEGVMLKDALGNQRSFFYIYDFGDNWEHKIEITDILEHDPKLIYPVCTGGENACPPENCGGVAGFAELKEILAGKKSRERDRLLSWIGGFYSPSTFDPNFINKNLLWPEIDEDLEPEDMEI